jgi:membrane associated rhomboid family serine protease
MYDGENRRLGKANDTGARRRDEDIAQRQEEFRLLRDKVLLLLGASGLLGLALAAVAFDIKNQAIALAALTAFSGILGAPTVLRLDEKRRGNGSA